MNDFWLEGYEWGAILLNSKFHHEGWARSKGWIKKQLSLLHKIEPDSQFYRGFTDALLDACN